MNMIERVAAAIFQETDFDGLGDDVKAAMFNRARKAIEVMREPTDEMWTAGATQVMDPWEWRKDNPNDEGRNIWRAMIDAALSDSV